MRKLIRWLNDSKLLSFLCTPWRIKRFYRTYQRVRMCEECGNIGKNVHWSKDDKIEHYIKLSGEPLRQRTIYGHKWLCDYCYYPELFKR